MGGGKRGEWREMGRNSNKELLCFFLVSNVTSDVKIINFQV